MKRKLHKIITKLSTIVTKSTLGKLESISNSILSMKGRVTMLGISRWSKEYSYKTIERFFEKKLDWLKINWQLVKDNIGDEVILVADESTISKSGKSTHGLGYFYSGLQGRAIKGIQFLSFSLVDVETKRGYPLLSKQLKKVKRAKKSKIKNKEKGRPKGSKNKNRSDIRLKGLFRVVSWYLRIINRVIKLPNLRYFVYDGAFGNNMGIQSARKNKLHLISKLKKNSALYFKFDGKQKSKGRKQIYGELIDYENIDAKYIKDSKVENNIEITIYQMTALNKKIFGELNIVIIVAKKGNKITHQILFSTDTTQEYFKIQEYYSLRFQIEFNFRDAKQYFGLEDFMNIKKRRVYNFVNLSMFMNNITYLTAKESGYSKYSVNDIKSLFLAHRYALEVLKIYGEKVDDILIEDIVMQVSEFSLIHRNAA